MNLASTRAALWKKFKMAPIWLILGCLTALDSSAQHSGFQCDPAGSGKSLIMHESLAVFLKDHNTICFLEPEMTGKFKIKKVFPIKEETIDFSISGKRLYAITHDRLYVYDIRDLNNIVLLSEFSDFKDEPLLGSIMVRDNFAYVAEIRHGFFLLNVANPKNITKADFVPIIGSEFSKPVLHRNLLFLSDENRLNVLEQDPGHKLRLKKSFTHKVKKNDTDDPDADYSCLPDGDLLYVANNKNFLILLISNNGEVSLKGEMPLPRPWEYTGEDICLAKAGPGKLLVSNGGPPVFFLIDIANPAKPKVLLHKMEDPFSPGAFAPSSMETANDKLYATGYRENLFNVYSVDWPHKLDLIFSLCKSIGNQ